MKILKIELQNINSLKSPHPIVIDFESPAFEDVGLYAITGSTGAGKTTILDAITIALYQQVPRFNRSNSRGSLPDVVSYGAEEAMARVTFSVKEARYEAQWDIRLTTKNGKLLGTPIENVRLKNLSSDQILAEKKKEFKNTIEQISQLTYSQFLRSVMLAQGEFAAFLSAPQKEKGKLLEQITGEEIYKKIGEKISEKRSEAIGELQVIQGRINEEDLLSDEQLADFRQTVTQHTKTLQQINFQLEQTEKILQWHEKASRLAKEKNEIDHALNLLSEKKENNKALTEKVAIHEDAAIFREKLDLISQMKRSLDEKRARFPQLRQDVKKITKDVEKTSADAEKAKNNLTTAREEEKAWSTRLTEVTRLDTVIGQATSECDNLARKQSSLQKQTEELSQNLSDRQKSKKQAVSDLDELKAFLLKKQVIKEVIPKIADWRVNLMMRVNKYEESESQKNTFEKEQGLLSSIQNDLTSSKGQLEEMQQKSEQLLNELGSLEKNAEGDDLKRMLAQQDELRKEHQLLRDGNSLLQQIEEASARIDKLEVQKLQQSKVAEEAEDDLKKLAEASAAASAALSDAERIYDLEKKIESVEEERKKLVNGEPCHVCGSTEHPYVTEYLEISLTATQQKVQERKASLEAVRNNLRDADVKKASAETLLDELTKQLTDLHGQLILHKKAFEKLQFGESLTRKKDFDRRLEEVVSEMEKTDLKIRFIEKNQQEQKILREQIDLQRNNAGAIKDTVAGLEAQIRTRKEQLEAIKEKRAQLQTEISGIEEELQAEMLQFEINLPSVDKTTPFINAIEKKIADYQKAEQDARELETSIERSEVNIENINENLTGKIKELDELTESLKVQKDSLAENRKKRNLILPANTTVEQKLLELEESIAKASKRAEEVTDELQHLKLNQSNLTKELSLLEEEGKNTGKKLKLAEATLSEELTNTRFADIDSLKKSLLTAAEEKSYRASLLELQKEEVALQTREQEWQKAHEALSAEKNSDQSQEEASAEKTSLSESKDQINNELGEIKAKTDADRKIRDRNQRILGEMEVQEKEVKKWSALLKLIGGSKDAFNTYVQRLTLQNLIYLANIHLAKLNPRYSLEMEAEYSPGDELNFKLTDHYQADEKRLVDTSSGGEKFLISLSLALGLSDLSSHNVSVGSLFIDEGFGTLDSRTLETVIATLETLQAQGKMIGIISHVENLKERITTQVQVVKKNNGVSEVTIR